MSSTEKNKKTKNKTNQKRKVSSVNIRDNANNPSIFVKICLLRKLVANP